MQGKSHTLRQSVAVFSAVCGSLLMSLPLLPQVVTAQQPLLQQPSSRQPNSQVNPCPGIFYEEPYNNRALVPVGCPPNALTQQLLNQGLLNPSSEQIRQGIGGEAPTGTTASVLNPRPSIFQEVPYNRLQPSLTTPSAVPVTPIPSSRQQQSPIATVFPINNLVNVRLINDSGATITYQVIGDTAPRSLPGKSNVTLRGLRTPITVTFYREDAGLLTVTPQKTSPQGTLEVNLRATTDTGRDQGALIITENGSVYLN